MKQQLTPQAATTPNRLYAIALGNLDKIRTSSGRPCWIYGAYKDYLVAEAEAAIDQLFVQNLTAEFREELTKLKQEYAII